MKKFRHRPRGLYTKIRKTAQTRQVSKIAQTQLRAKTQDQNGAHTGSPQFANKSTTKNKRRKYIKSKTNLAKCEHEASTSKVSEEQLFYLLQRGIEAEEAVALMVNGFCKEVFKELPMEFAVEAQKLLEVSLEGSVG